MSTPRVPQQRTLHVISVQHKGPAAHWNLIVPEDASISTLRITAPELRVRDHGAQIVPE